MNFHCNNKCTVRQTENFLFDDHRDNVLHPLLTKISYILPVPHAIHVYVHLLIPEVGTNLRSNARVASLFCAPYFIFRSHRYPSYHILFC